MSIDRDNNLREREKEILIELPGPTPSEVIFSFNLPLIVNAGPSFPINEEISP